MAVPDRRGYGRSRLKAVVSSALEAFLSVVDRYSLADIAGNRAALAELLDIRGGLADVP